MAVLLSAFTATVPTFGYRLGMDWARTHLFRSSLYACRVEHLQHVGACRVDYSQRYGLAHTKVRPLVLPLSLLRSGSALVPELPGWLPAATASVGRRIVAGNSALPTGGTPIGIPSAFRTLSILRLFQILFPSLYTRVTSMCWYRCSHPVTHLTPVLYPSVSRIFRLAERCPDSMYGGIEYFN
jgi:hypothetical protein